MARFTGVELNAVGGRWERLEPCQVSANFGSLSAFRTFLDECVSPRTGVQVDDLGLGQQSGHRYETHDDPLPVEGIPDPS